MICPINSPSSPITLPQSLCIHHAPLLPFLKDGKLISNTAFLVWNIVPRFPPGSFSTSFGCLFSYHHLKEAFPNHSWETCHQPHNQSPSFYLIISSLTFNIWCYVYIYLFSLIMFSLLEYKLTWNRIFMFYLTTMSLVLYI